MRRRDLMIAAGAAVLFHSGRGRAQEPGRIYRLGVIVPRSRNDPLSVELLAELGRQGFVEGKNLRVDPKGFDTPVDRFYAVAVDMAKGVDVIASAGSAAGAPALQRATHTIPIVAVSDDFLEEKLVTSLAHPGGNITGVSIFASELDGKRQELLLELVPRARHIAALADPRTTGPSELEELRTAARSRGVELTVISISRPDEIAGGIGTARMAGAEALNVLASLPLFTNRKLIILGAARARLPAIYQWPEEATDGGLVAYGPNHLAIMRQQARLIAAVLRGTKPEDLPVEQPDKFELVINLKTAKALDLALPPLLLARADKVIE